MQKMTEKEAIEGLKNLFSEHGLALPGQDSLEVLNIAIAALEEIQQYREIEKRLEKMFGGELTLTKYVDELERALKEPDNPHPINARILTYEDAKMWDEYRAIGTVEDLKSMKENGAFTGIELAEIVAMQMKLKEYQQLEEQGKLLRLPVAVSDVVDKLFSHNETISLWREVKEETTYHKRIWYGMAWDIPDGLKECTFVKIFGTIPESIVHADIINIEVVLSKEAEAALERMEGEEHEVN